MYFWLLFWNKLNALQTWYWYQSSVSVALRISWCFLPVKMTLYTLIKSESEYCCKRYMPGMLLQFNTILGLRDGKDWRSLREDKWQFMKCFCVFFMMPIYGRSRLLSELKGCDNFILDFCDDIFIYYLFSWKHHPCKGRGVTA